MTTTEASTALSIRAGSTLLLEQRGVGQRQCLTVQSGLLRVAASKPDQEALQSDPVILGFLQAGDQLPLDLLRNTRLHLEALSFTQLIESGAHQPDAGCNSLHDWTLALLLIRNLHDAEQRIGALLQLLVERLGRRSGDWYELPLRFTHSELAALSGHTRVTVTRQFSRWREQGLLVQDAGPDRLLRVSPELVAV
jgi:CRP-like cAMP-binding protein